LRLGVRRRRSVPEDEIRQQVTKTLLSLRQALSDEDVIRAKTAIMKHVGRLVLTPVVKGGRGVYRVSGSVGVPVENRGMLLVARDGIEPPPAFLGQRGVTIISLKVNTLIRSLRSKKTALNATKCNHRLASDCS
jgi:hypothetical protein